MLEQTVVLLDPLNLKGIELRYDTVRVRTQSSPYSFAVLYQEGKEDILFYENFYALF